MAFIQLTALKKNAKEIKERNKLNAHRSLWLKEMEYLNKITRNMANEMTESLEQLDDKLDIEIVTRKIFGSDKYKSYSEMARSKEDEFTMHKESVERQVEMLPILLEKCSTSEDGFSWEEVHEVLVQINHFLDEINHQNEDNYKQLSAQIELKEEEDSSDEDDDLFFNIKSITSAKQIKGFDIESKRIERIKLGEQNLLSYLNSLSDRLTEDEISSVIAEFEKAAQLLEQTFELEIENIALDYEEALKLEETTLKESDNFAKVNHIYQMYVGRGRQIGLYYERLAIEFPKIPRKTLECLTSYLDARIFKARKTKAAKRNYLREKEELLMKVEKEVNNRIEAKIKLAQEQAERLQKKEERLKLEEELQKLRAAYKIKQDAKRIEETAKEEEKQQLIRKKEAVRKLYLDDLNKKAQEIQVIKQERERKEEEETAKLHQQKIDEAKKNLIANKPKVVARQSIENSKIVQKFEAKLQREKEPLLRQERIDKAVESYQFRPQVEASEERLVAPTTALVIKQETKMDKADKVTLSKVTGYNINQLMSDMRFRLGTAFQEAGLHQTDYARQVILHMSKREP